MLLMNSWTPAKKIQIMLVAGIAGVALGYAMNPFIPVIKHICTSSFVILSGGWCLIAMAFSYWLIDVKNFSRGTLFFAIVGMNPLFIYLFAHTNGTAWIRAIVKPFSNAIFGGLGELPGQMILAAFVWAGLWGICYFLYKRKIFIKL
jgi:predicted acyltransferase